MLVICSWHIWKYFLQSFAYIVVARLSSVSLSGLAQSLSLCIPFCIHLEVEILVLYWMCWADSGTCSEGEALCALRQQWFCGSLCGGNCRMLSVTESTWDGVTKTFCVVATARWTCSALRSRDIDAGASGSQLVWLLFHLAGVAERLGFVWRDAARSSKAIHAKPCEFSSQESDVFISLFS